MRTPLRVPKGHYTPLASPYNNHIPFSSAFLLHVCPTGCAILSHAWNPIAYSRRGKLHGRRRRRRRRRRRTRQRKKARAFTSVKRLGNCSSVVGRPATDDAIFEDNAGRSFAPGNPIVSMRSMETDHQTACLPAKRINFRKVRVHISQPPIVRREIELGSSCAAMTLYLPRVSNGSENRKLEYTEREFSLFNAKQ